MGDFNTPLSSMGRSPRQKKSINGPNWYLQKTNSTAAELLQTAKC